MNIKPSILFPNTFIEVDYPIVDMSETDPQKQKKRIQFLAKTIREASKLLGTVDIKVLSMYRLVSSDNEIIGEIDNNHPIFDQVGYVQNRVMFGSPITDVPILNIVKIRALGGPYSLLDIRHQFVNDDFKGSYRSLRMLNCLSLHTAYFDNVTFQLCLEYIQSKTLVDVGNINRMALIWLYRRFFNEGEERYAFHSSLPKHRIKKFKKHLLQNVNRLLNRDSSQEN